MSTIQRTWWFAESLNNRPDSTGYDNGTAPYRVSSPDEANLVSSLTVNGIHAPVLDLDVEAQLIPSSTPGHSHLYIDKEIPWANYWDILRSLEHAGIIESGFVKAARRDGATFLRKPGTYKPGTLPPKAPSQDDRLEEKEKEIKELQAEVRHLQNQLARHQQPLVMTWE